MPQDWPFFRAQYQDTTAVGPHVQAILGAQQNRIAAQQAMAQPIQHAFDSIMQQRLAANQLAAQQQMEHDRVTAEHRIAGEKMHNDRTLQRMEAESRSQLQLQEHALKLKELAVENARMDAELFALYNPGTGESDPVPPQPDALSLPGGGSIPFYSDAQPTSRIDLSAASALRLPPPPYRPNTAGLRPEQTAALYSAAEAKRKADIDDARLQAAQDAQRAKDKAAADAQASFTQNTLASALAAMKDGAISKDQYIAVTGRSLQDPKGAAEDLATALAASAARSADKETKGDVVADNPWGYGFSSAARKGGLVREMSDKVKNEFALAADRAVQGSQLFYRLQGEMSSLAADSPVRASHEAALMAERDRVAREFYAHYGWTKDPDYNLPFEAVTSPFESAKAEAPKAPPTTQAHAAAPGVAAARRTGLSVNDLSALAEIKRTQGAAAALQAWLKLDDERRAKLNKPAPPPAPTATPGYGAHPRGGQGPF